MNDQPLPRYLLPILVCEGDLRVVVTVRIPSVAESTMCVRTAFGLPTLSAAIIREAAEDWTGGHPAALVLDRTPWPRPTLRAATPEEARHLVCGEVPPR